MDCHCRHRPRRCHMDPQEGPVWPDVKHRLRCIVEGHSEPNFDKICHFLKAQRVQLNDFKLYSGSGTPANVTDRSIGHPVTKVTDMNDLTQIYRPPP